MKIYNKKTNSINELQYLEMNDGLHKIEHVTEEELNNLDLYKVNETVIPDATLNHITTKKELIDNVYNITYTSTSKSLQDLKDESVKNINIKYNISTRPRVPTTLGFDIDGSDEDLANFKNGKLIGLLTVRDADNIQHDIALADYDIIIDAIINYKMTKLQQKWSEIDNIKNYNLTEMKGYLNGNI